MNEKEPANPCTCPGGPNDDTDGDQTACIRGEVFEPCESENCGGVCTPGDACPCPLHKSPSHDSGFGGTYSE